MARIQYGSSHASRHAARRPQMAPRLDDAKWNEEHPLFIEVYSATMSPVTRAIRAKEVRS